MTDNKRFKGYANAGILIGAFAFIWTRLKAVEEQLRAKAAS